MQLQLLNVIIWPKDKNFAPRILYFKPGKLNVITGQSRTGKSAIIPIIDYCLASSDCFIPIDTIRDYASWYGIIFQTDSEEVLLSRRVPNGREISDDFFILRASSISIPPFINEPNEKINGVKNILNTISSVPYLSLDNNSISTYQSRLSFRDMVALVFQNQDIVANQNILFYKTHAHVHRERLRNWFPYILGAENIKTLQARHQLQELEQQLKLLRREFEKIQHHSSSWANNLKGYLKVASEYGLLEENIIDQFSTEEMITAIKQIINNIPDYSNTQAENIRTAVTEISKLEMEEENIANKIGLVKKRLSNLKLLSTGIIDYGNSVLKRVERLQISQWLVDISSDLKSCPICGSCEHPKGTSELHKISEAFKMNENELKKVETIPTSFTREEERLNSELDKLIQEHKYIQTRYDTIISHDKQAQEEFQSRKNMYLFLGHLKAALETFESLGDGGEYKTEISKLEFKIKEKSLIADREGIRRKVEAYSLRISQKILKHIKDLDVEDKYRNTAPKFDVDELNIMVLSSDDNWHYLAEVGSASNWVSFHLALFCSLQEHFLEQITSSVPSFVIFDQPSQVYFPKVDRNTVENLDPQFVDEDIVAVKKIFKMVSDSIISNNGRWQGIILDHADKSIYGKIEGVYEVDEWRNGKKLIPEEWYI